MLLLLERDCSDYETKSVGVHDQIEKSVGLIKLQKLIKIYLPEEKTMQDVFSPLSQWVLGGLMT